VWVSAEAAHQNFGVEKAKRTFKFSSYSCNFMFQNVNYLFVISPL